MATVGRNSPCPCGSGAKYKKCCLQKVLRHGLAGDRAEEASATTQASRELPGGPARCGSEEKEVEPGRIDRELPAIDPQERCVIDTWRREFGPVYKRRDTDEMLRLINRFLDTEPKLFIHLGLDDECMFQLGGDLHGKGQHGRYFELLQRIRREQPQAYLRAYGYYDVDVIVELVVSGRRAEVPPYFNWFKAYPDSYPDQLSTIMDVLLSTNCDSELFDLARGVAVPVYCSSRVIDGWFVLGWVIFEQMVPVLDRRDASEAAVEEVFAHLGGLSEAIDLDEIRDVVAEDIRETLGGFPDMRCVNWGKRTARKGFYVSAARDFTRWLHERRGVSWASSRHFANKVADYLMDTASRAKARGAFVLDEDRLDRHIIEQYKRFFWIDGVLGMSLLQGVHWFAEYLEEQGVHGEKDTAQIQGACRTLCEGVKKACDASDSGPRLFASFPRYSWVA